MDRGEWQARVHGIPGSDMTERLLSKASFSYVCRPECSLIQNILWKNLSELFGQPSMLASKKHGFLDE